MDEEEVEEGDEVGDGDDDENGMTIERFCVCLRVDEEGRVVIESDPEKSLCVDFLDEMFWVEKSREVGTEAPIVLPEDRAKDGKAVKMPVEGVEQDESKVAAVAVLVLRPTKQRLGAVLMTGH